MDHFKKGFIVEKEGMLPMRGVRCLVDFKGRFVLIINRKESKRYYLAEDRWENFPLAVNLGAKCVAC